MSALSPEQELRLSCLRLSDTGHGPNINLARQIEAYVLDSDGHARRVAADLHALANYVNGRLARMIEHGPSFRFDFSELNRTSETAGPVPEVQTGGTDAPPR